MDCEDLVRQAGRIERFFMQIDGKRYFMRTTSVALALLVSLQVAAEPVREVEGDVVAAFLNFEGKNLDPGKSIVVQQETAPLSNAFFDKAKNRRKTLSGNFPEASKALISDFVHVGNDPGLVKISRNLVNEKIAIVVMDRKSLDDIFRTKIHEGGWESFYDANPTATGLMRFSRVGLDRENGQALVYVEYNCGVLCGSGFLVLLKYQQGHWDVIRDVRLWIS